MYNSIIMLNAAAKIILTFVVSTDEQSSSGVRAREDFRCPKRPLGALAIK